MPGSRSSGIPHLSWDLGAACGCDRARVERRGLVLLGHGGPLLEVVSLADAQHLPEGRHQAGDRHLNFHETWDNLRR